MMIRKVLLMMAVVTGPIMSPAWLHGQESDAEASAPTADTVIARVNGEEIRLGHVIAFAGKLPPRYDQVESRNLYDSIVDELVKHSLLASYGENQSLLLRYQGENIARTNKAEETISTIVGELTTEERINAIYQEQYVQSEAQQEFKASHILVATEEEAAEIVGDLRAGADFAETAKARSTGPSGPRGGDLGWFAEGQMVKAFEQAVMAMTVGDISGPVQSQFGWHVILLEGKRDLPVPSLEEAREEIRQFIMQRTIETLLLELTMQATVERLDQDIDPDVIRNPGLLQGN